MPVSDSLEAIAMRQEAERFESVCPNIQSLYDLLEGIDNVPLKRKIRELVNRIEGKWIISGSLWCKHRYNFDVVVSKSSVRLRFSLKEQPRGFELTPATQLAEIHVRTARDDGAMVNTKPFTWLHRSSSYKTAVCKQKRSRTILRKSP